jgi:hypothetical protein
MSNMRKIFAQFAVELNDLHRDVIVAGELPAGTLGAQ